MYKEIAVELITGNIINTTCSIGDIAQNDGVAVCEHFDYITDHAPEQHEALGELQGHCEDLFA